MGQASGLIWCAEVDGCCHRRRSREWRKLGGGPIANLGLWQRLIAAVERHSSVRFECIPRTGNKRADRLAGQARMAALLTFGSSLADADGGVPFGQGLGDPG